MLPRSERVTLRRDFEQIYSQGRVFQNALFRLSLCLAPPAVRKAGFVVGKKVSKKAVERNRLRRQMREAYRQLRDKTGSGFMVLVSAKRPSLGIGFFKIKESMKKLLVQAHVYEQNSDSID